MSRRLSVCHKAGAHGGNQTGTAESFGAVKSGDWLHLKMLLIRHRHSFLKAADRAGSDSLTDAVLLLFIRREQTYLNRHT